MLRKLSLAYTSGTVAALIACLVLWISGREGLNAWLGVSLRTGMTTTWLAPRLIFGGLCGLFLTLPILPGRLSLRAVLIGLVPAAYSLLVYFPGTGRGLFGFGYGALTPLLVGGLCLLWGLFAAFWYRLVRG